MELQKPTNGEETPGSIPIQFVITEDNYFQGENGRAKSRNIAAKDLSQLHQSVSRGIISIEQPAPNNPIATVTMQVASISSDQQAHDPRMQDTLESVPETTIPEEPVHDATADIGAAWIVGYNLRASPSCVLIQKTCQNSPDNRIKTVILFYYTQIH